jgi:hypothetical protein
MIIFQHSTLCATYVPKHQILHDSNNLLHDLFFFTHFTSIISTFFPFLDCSVDRPLPPRQIDQHLAMAASANSLYALYPENNVADLSFLDYELIHLATDCHDAAAMYNKSAVGWPTLTKVDRQKQRQNVFLDTWWTHITRHSPLWAKQKTVFRMYMSDSERLHLEQ